MKKNPIFKTFWTRIRIVNNLPPSFFKENYWMAIGPQYWSIRFRKNMYNVIAVIIKTSISYWEKKIFLQKCKTILNIKKQNIQWDLDRT